LSGAEVSSLLDDEEGELVSVGLLPRKLLLVGDPDRGSSVPLFLKYLYLRSLYEWRSPTAFLSNDPRWVEVFSREERKVDESSPSGAGLTMRIGTLPADDREAGDFLPSFARDDGALRVEGREGVIFDDVGSVVVVFFSSDDLADNVPSCAVEDKLDDDEIVVTVVVEP